MSHYALRIEHYTRGGVFPYNGEVSERLKERDWKSRSCRKVAPGFESQPLRSSFYSRYPIALVAQLDRASACGAEGSEFKSRRARHFSMMRER